MTAQFQPGRGTEPASIIEVSISCKNLLDKDIFSRSDPMCVVYSQHPGLSLSLWDEILRTEIVWDNLNPQFTTKLVINYRFEEDQRLRFELYDIDAPSQRLADHDFLGLAECPLARIVATGYHGLSLPLSQDQRCNYKTANLGGSKGTLLLVAEELSTHKEEFSVKFTGHCMGSRALRLLPWYPGSRIFFTVSKINETGKYVIVYKSKAKLGPHPKWEVMSMSTGSLCGGDKERGIRIEFFKNGVNGYHKLIGRVDTNVVKLQENSTSSTKDMSIINSNGKKVIPSSLVISECKLSPIYSFVDFIQGGTQLHAYFAIDMTGSNGDPSQSDSLHYINSDPNRTNAYEQAVQSVGQIIEEYSTNKMFPAYGFGARVPPMGEISHRFNLNLQNSRYMCHGIGDVLENYRRCIRQVQLWGPTNFAPIIRNVAEMALEDLQSLPRGRNYFILLIITDGIISDMEATKEAIVKASGLPLSIIIVGVGGADFEAMDILDGDSIRLSSNGVFAERDIVQFVPYRDAYSWLQSLGMTSTNRTTTTSGWPAPNPAASASSAVAGSSHANTTRLAKAKLAREVLAEVPLQLTSYMKSQHIVPGILNGPSAPPPPYFMASSSSSNHGS